MRPAPALLPLLFLFLFASVESRQAPRIQNLLGLKSDIQSVNDAKTQEQVVEGVKHKCEESLVTNTKMTIEKEVITEDFEPRTSITSYNDGDTIATLKKKFVKNDFKPRPSITSYNDEVGPKAVELTVDNEFEPRPSVTSYNDGVIGATMKKKIVKNFEFGHKGEKPMVNVEFEPRPSATKYND